MSAPVVRRRGVLATDAAAFEERVAAEAATLQEELAEGTFDNPQAIVGLEQEFHAVDGESCALRRVPRPLVRYVGFEKERGRPRRRDAHQFPAVQRPRRQGPVPGGEFAAPGGAEPDPHRRHPAGDGRDVDHPADRRGRRPVPDRRGDRGRPAPGDEPQRRRPVPRLLERRSRHRRRLRGAARRRRRRGRDPGQPDDDRPAALPGAGGRRPADVLRLRAVDRRPPPRGRRQLAVRAPGAERRRRRPRGGPGRRLAGAPRPRLRGRDEPPRRPREGPVPERPRDRRGGDRPHRRGPRRRPHGTGGGDPVRRRVRPPPAQARRLLAVGAPGLRRGDPGGRQRAYRVPPAARPADDPRRRRVPGGLRRPPGEPPAARTPRGVAALGGRTRELLRRRRGRLRGRPPLDHGQRRRDDGPRGRLRRTLRLRRRGPAAPRHPGRAGPGVRRPAPRARRAGTTPAAWKRSEIRRRLDDGASIEDAVHGMQREYVRRQAESLYEGSFLEWL